MDRSVIRLRPHHFICVHGFRGKGYSLAFVRNFWSVVERLKDDETFVEAVGGTAREDICAPCPNNMGTVCVEESKIQSLDSAYAATLGVATGDRLSWKAAKELVARKVADEEFDRNCEPCGWKRLGICKEALRALRETTLAVAACVALGAGASVATAWAIEQPSISQEPGPTAVDVLEQRLVSDKKRRITAFGRVQEALSKRHFDLALKEAKALESSEEFRDYFHFLSGQASLGRLRKFMKSGQLANAQLAGEQASYHFSQTIGTSLHATLERRATGLLGETEVAMAEIRLKKKQPVRARQHYENGFSRLSQANLMMLVSKASVVSYALLCERLKAETSADARDRHGVCMSWVIKLAPLVAKSEEAKILERVAAFKRPYIERSTSIPYRVDLDAQEFQKGFAQYLSGRHADAYVTFGTLLKEYPRTAYKLRTKFWMGRAAQKAGYIPQSETLFRQIIKEAPFAYYALLASWHGRIDLARAVEAELPLASSEAPMLTPTEVARIRRAETLIASGVPELALFELQEVRPAQGMPNDFLVYLTMLNHLAGSHGAAFQVFFELSARGYGGLYSSYGQKLFFPAARMPLIRAASQEWKVDPLLVLSVIKQESAFNAEASSSASAYGLMQIIPPTARELDPKIEPAELFDPERNVRLGAKYLFQLTTRYKGNLALTLAAYNAGPSNADRWSREIPGGTPLDEFIEQVSFRETREYIQSILRNYYWYNRRLKGDAAPTLEALAFKR